MTFALLRSCGATQGGTNWNWRKAHPDRGLISPRDVMELPGLRVVSKSYDYISSAVWEVFGPTSVIKVIEFNWPTGLEGEKRLSCVDIESALDGLALDRPPERWCVPRDLVERGGVVSAAMLTLDPPQTQ